MTAVASLVRFVPMVLAALTIAAVTLAYAATPVDGPAREPPSAAATSSADTSPSPSPQPSLVSPSVATVPSSVQPAPTPPTKLPTEVPATPLPRPIPSIAPLPVVACGNAIDNSGGLGLICEVTVENTITAAGGSATTTVRECHGAAGDPQAACVTFTSTQVGRVASVAQCNGSINGGGGVLRCSVVVTNTFVGLAVSTLGASVNQCVGSGGGITAGCVPYPATAVNATITQCNGSGNGGTLVSMACIAAGTQSAVQVTVNQCNGSANGGGSLLSCSTIITNRVRPG